MLCHIRPATAGETETKDFSLLGLSTTTIHPDRHRKFHCMQ